MSEKCKWQIGKDFDDITYITSCNEEVTIFEDYTPSDCNYKYCPYCGKEIEEVKDD